MSAVMNSKGANTTASSKGAINKNEELSLKLVQSLERVFVDNSNPKKPITLDPKKPTEQETIKHLFNLAINLVGPCMGAISLAVKYGMPFYGNFAIVSGKTATGKERPGILDSTARGKHDSLVAAEKLANELITKSGGDQKLKPFFAMIEYIKVAINVLKDKSYSTKIQTFLIQGGKSEVENSRVKKGAIVLPLLLNNFDYQQATSMPKLENAKLIDVLLREKELFEYLSQLHNTNPAALHTSVNTHLEVTLKILGASVLAANTAATNATTNAAANTTASTLLTQSSLGAAFASAASSASIAIASAGSNATPTTSSTGSATANTGISVTTLPVLPALFTPSIGSVPPSEQPINKPLQLATTTATNGSPIVNSKQITLT